MLRALPVSQRVTLPAKRPATPEGWLSRPVPVLRPVCFPGRLYCYKPLTRRHLPPKLSIELSIFSLYFSYVFDPRTSVLPANSDIHSRTDKGRLSVIYWLLRPSITVQYQRCARMNARRAITCRKNLGKLRTRPLTQAVLTLLLTKVVADVGFVAACI